MSRLFEEIDSQTGPLGLISLRPPTHADARRPGYLRGEAQ